MSDPRKNRPSASAFYRYALCPGSWQLSLTAPPQPTSADAAAGTALHAHLEHGTTPAGAEDAEAVEWCRQKCAELLETYLGTNNAAPVTIRREQRMWDAQGRFSGQPDEVAIYRDRALIVDYKFGRSPVEPAASNAQLYALTYLLFTTEPHLQEIYASILQPWVTRSPQVVKFSRQSDLASLTSYVDDTLEAINTEHPSCHPGTTQCKYCPAVSSCHALSLRVQSLPAVPTENWSLFRPDQKRAAYDAAKLARKYADEIDRLVKADLAAEHDIPGLSLTAGKQTNKVQDINAAFSLLAEHGLTPADFITACSLSLSKLQTPVHALLNAKEPTTKAAAKEWLLSTLAPLITTSTSQPSIKDTL